VAVADELARLIALRDAGHLTDEEFQGAKDALLGQTRISESMTPEPPTAGIHEPPSGDETPQTLAAASEPTRRSRRPLLVALAVLIVLLAGGVAHVLSGSLSPSASPDTPPPLVHGSVGTAVSISNGSQHFQVTLRDASRFPGLQTNADIEVAATSGGPLSYSASEFYLLTSTNERVSPSGAASNFGVGQLNDGESHRGELIFGAVGDSSTLVFAPGGTILAEWALTFSSPDATPSATDSPVPPPEATPSATDSPVPPPVLSLDQRLLAALEKATLASDAAVPAGAVAGPTDEPGVSTEGPTAGLTGAVAYTVTFANSDMVQVDVLVFSDASSASENLKGALQYAAVNGSTAFTKSIGGRQASCIPATGGSAECLSTTGSTVERTYLSGGSGDDAATDAEISASMRALLATVQKARVSIGE